MRALFVVVIMVLFASCSKPNSSEPKGPVFDDRSKFVGTWAGSYSCLGGTPNADTLVIRLANAELDFSIIIHKQYAFTDTVTGSLTESNVITVPEQTMGGFPGTAKITFKNELLEYRQSGFGITCGGADYARVR